MAKQGITYPGFEVSEDYAFQKIAWFIQRIGKVLMFLFVIGCLLGLVGKGLFSQQQAAGATANIKFEMFGRNQSPTQIQIELTENVQPLTIDVSKSLINKYQIEQIVPEPEKVTVRQNVYSYTFDSNRLGKDTVISFYLEPQEIGIYSGSVRVSTDKSLSIRQFIYP